MTMKFIARIIMPAVFFAFLLSLGAGSAAAQGKHPAYLHALSDLRAARAHLSITTAENCGMRKRKPFTTLMTRSTRSRKPPLTTART